MYSYMDDCPNFLTLVDKWLITTQDAYDMGMKCIILIAIILIIYKSNIDGYLLPEQQHIIRQHFFEVVHATNRTSGQTQYTKFVRLREVSLFVSIDEFASFEFPCGKRSFLDTQDIQHYGFEAILLVPCSATKEDLTFVPSLSPNKTLLHSECRQIAGNEYISISLEAYNETTRRIPEVAFQNLTSSVNLSVYPNNRPIIKMSYWTKDCSITCPAHDNSTGTDTIVKNVRCNSVEQKKKNRRKVLVCDFEIECSWYFQSPEMVHNETTAIEENFMMVEDEESKLHGKRYALMEMPEYARPAAMIISPFYAQTSQKCSLQLDYRLLGMRGDARIIISTEHRPPDNANLTAEEIEQLRTPVQHAILDVENSFYPSSVISIGHFSLPTRIRIECHNNLNGTIAPPSAPGYTATTCYVDNIVLIDCEEHVTMENACSSTSDAMFICTSLGMKKCIEWDAVCDGRVDCPNGEDEEDCDFSLVGSKCDFESEDSLCAGWEHQTMLVTTHTRISEEMFIRANYTSAIEDNPSARIPHYDRTIGEKGHFLWMSRRGHELFATKQTSTRFYSPIYPPTVRKGSSPRNSEDLCFLRFWYCHYTTYTLPILKWDIVTGIKKPNRTQLMWSFDEPQYMQESTFCEWRRASIKLRPQRTPFQLQFSITPFIGEDPVILAIDDISLSPSCFPRDNLLSSFYNLSSCGAIGPRPITMEICEKFLTTSSSNISSVSSIEKGIQIWVAPETSEYRIELCGAAGGWLPGLKDLNGGGCVYALVNISQHDSITFVIGQQGMSPCDKKIMARSPELQLLCLNGSLQDDSLDSLPGSGGGGASKFLLSRTMTLLVAGGGGGLWLGASDEDSEVPMGGREVKEISKKYKKRQISQISSLLAGYGGSESDVQLFDGDCVDCIQMSGDVTTGRAGICSRKRNWNVPGGFGGGGASCGPGSAGGGGHIGGSPGNRSHGYGGTSWADEQILADFQANANHGGGYALIHPCKLMCPTNATCHFVHPREFIVICRCNSNGQFVKEDGICLDDDKELSDLELSEHSTLHINILILITCASISTMSVLCMCFVRRRYDYTRRKRYSNEVPLKMRPPRLEARGIYEETAAEIIVDDCTLEQLEELPTIERPNIVLRDLLGHGAFGEVYKADLLLNGAVHQVAVKTLPFSSSKQSQDEFLMEAQIMNKFRHENIITLYGINFDLMPRYIVLELMNGGDLKSFLRTSRPNKLSANPNNLMMCNLVKMALDVAKGCEFLEANKFIHRDIAARNCLLSTAEPNSVVKIADFGMARDIYRSDYYRKGGHAMLPVKWMPPEALLDGFFTTKTDVWSFGVLTWEIFSLGYMPYPGRNNMEVMELIANGGRLEPPIGVPHQVYQLMLQCWKTDEKARPSFSMIVPWLHRIYEDPTVSHLHLPDRTISLPSTALPTPMAETPRSEVTMSTTLNTPCGDFTPDGMNDPFSRGLGVSFNVCQPYQSKTGNGFLLSQQQCGSIAEDESNILDDEQIAMLPENSFPQQFPEVSHVSGAYEWCAQPPKPQSAHNGTIVLDALSSDPPLGEIPRPNRLFVHKYDPELHAPPPPPRRPTTLRTANQLIDEQREIASRSQESSRETSNENSKS